jgi:hypothetical protein
MTLNIDLEGLRELAMLPGFLYTGRRSGETSLKDDVRPRPFLKAWKLAAWLYTSGNDIVEKGILAMQEIAGTML